MLRSFLRLWTSIKREVFTFLMWSIYVFLISKTLILSSDSLERHCKSYKRRPNSSGVLKDLKTSVGWFQSLLSLESWPRPVRLNRNKVGKSCGTTSIKEKEVSVCNQLSMFGKSITFNDLNVHFLIFFNIVKPFY